MITRFIHAYKKKVNAAAFEQLAKMPQCHHLNAGGGLQLSLAGYRAAIKEQLNDSSRRKNYKLSTCVVAPLPLFAASSATTS